MSSSKQPLMICLVGVNGAGKTTYYREKFLKLRLPFLNADILAQELWPDDPDNHSYEAGRLLAQQGKLIWENDEAS